MLDSLIHADPARDLEPPPREHTRARLDALLAAPEKPRRRPVFAAAGLAAVAVLAAVVAATLPGGTSPAEAFANRLKDGGIVHMVLAHQRTHDASGDGVNPRQDELWFSLADGSWHLRSRLNGATIDMTFDGHAMTVRDSRTGKTTTDTPAQPAVLQSGPLGGPSVEPLADPNMRIAGETSLNGETVYDLVPKQAMPEGLELHWYVTKNGRPVRMVQSAGGSSLTTDVDSYEVLADTPANRALLR
jgi:hypothetical protein